MEKQWLDIDGSIQIDTTDDQFMNEFSLWLESKGWSFAGGTKLQDENEN